MKRHVNPTDTDRRLAAALLDERSEEAFRALYRRHTPRLFQFVMRLLGGAEPDAEDVVQETWIRATEGLGRFRWESSLGTWLTGIALNCCRDFWRRAGREIVQEHEHTANRDRTPRQPHDERIDLERAIGLLPTGYRAVFLLHDLEGFTHAEIAERFEITQGTSKSQLFAARRALRRLLGYSQEEMGLRDGT